MSLKNLQRWIAVGAMLALPVMAHAQEVTLLGTVTDNTGGALPGVTVVAVHEASGNTFEAVTDGSGQFQILGRVGSYVLTADLPGFTTATESATLLLGQEAVIDMQLAVGGVQETITVTGEAPLLDVTSSSMASNIDPRQMQELPIQGRDWVQLIMLAPGARVNSIRAGTPTDAGNERGGSYSSRAGGNFQITVDGQAVTQLATGAISPSKGQPRVSRDAMAEFEFQSSRFDATQGRSTGMQINAVTKSGTNTLSGSFSGFFRDDKLNAKDKIRGEVLPYKNQQLSGTLGGPILRDKVHFFAQYEYEREPRTFFYQTPFEIFNGTSSGTGVTKIYSGRGDAQFSPQVRLTGRANIWTLNQADSGSTPVGAGGTTGGAKQYLGTLTQVVTNRTVNEVKVGYAESTIDPFFNHKNPFNPYFDFGGPRIRLKGLDVGTGEIFPNRQDQKVWSFRDDLTLSFNKGGRHTVKMGGEYLHGSWLDWRCVRCGGQLRADKASISADLARQVFPDILDIGSWQLDLLAPVTEQWVQAFGAGFSRDDAAFTTRNTYAGWFQDDWTVKPRLTLNLGVRYDYEANAFTHEVEFLPFQTSDFPLEDRNNVSPRGGFSFSASDRTVVRGGYGLYFGTVATGIRGLFFASNVVDLTTKSDGRADFPSNPYNGTPPTFAELTAKQCSGAGGLVPGCVRRGVRTAGANYGPEFKMPYAHQVSLGVQQQVADTMAVEVDYVFTGHRDRQSDQPRNISYDPATGINFPFDDISKRPFPEWGYVSLTTNGTRANYHALQTSFTKRYSDRWQASGTYTLSAARDARPFPLQWVGRPGGINGAGFETVPFPTAVDFGGEYTLSGRDQRHRATVNTIVDLGYDFQLSGLYFFGSGQRWYTNWGVDLRDLGDRRPNELRLRPDGTIVPRSDFVGDQVHRVDMRLQRRISLGGRATIDGILEVFNVFDHSNFGDYEVREVRSNFGKPLQPRDIIAYGPRVVQLGFRLRF